MKPPFRADHVLKGFDGVEVIPDPSTPSFHGSDETVPVLTVTSKLQRSRPVMLESFEFLRSVTIHTCRGNFKSTRMTSGRYEPVAEMIFGALDVDGCFLEWRKLERIVEVACEVWG